ncbi:ATP-dependent zinc metalloprotease FtsH [Tautonia plasticadhaerens]|uniref:ATP-dependent zinc metalloprotease FtsH n=1 Tax=Tautonia plasticadhaerens TaxID=2527974 RepID=A0A518H703_9BACT|nr:ATP-dependent zinc metalloprotease FtsH [Tautonia plasticadhaerens]QDV36643.1 ATP-dependent zinc metalloprotease FtsH [Tautonia plasticadhaerens]
MSSPKSKPPRPASGPWRTLAWCLAISLALAAFAVAGAMSHRASSSEAWTYGAFRRALVDGRVESVRLGSRQLVAVLAEAGADGGPRRVRASWPGAQADPGLTALLDRHARDYEFDRDVAPIASALATFGLAVVLLVGLFLITRGGGLGPAMAFTRGKPRHREGTGREVTFDDVAGQDEAVEELQEVVGFLRTPERYAALGGRIPKGVLLIGPPGTGKTLLARAVAGEAGVPFFALSGSDFMEMYVGVGAARVRSLFAKAEAKAPCLIFIDEIDAIGKTRSTGASGAQDERDQTLNQLLVAMDGFDVNSGVIVMAATNRPETLDPALVRPGRFDRHIRVDRPDLQGREQILKVHSRDVPVCDRLDLRQVAAMTAGFAGAELANLVNEAVLIAARKGKTRIERADFEQGFERIIAGPEKRGRAMRPDERRRIAVHEAGHALVSASLPGTDPVHKVTIIGRGNGMGGFTMYRPEEERFLHTTEWLMHCLAGLLGGTAAEELALHSISDGATSDLQRATSIARKMVTDFGMSPALGRVCYAADAPGPGAPWSERTSREIDLEVRRILDEALSLAHHVLRRRADALVSITELLLERETIDASELRSVLDRHPDPGPDAPAPAAPGAATPPRIRGIGCN